MFMSMHINGVLDPFKKSERGKMIKKLNEIYLYTKF
jgi:hypothetical protein